MPEGWMESNRCLVVTLLAMSVCAVASAELLYELPPDLPKMPAAGQSLGQFLKPEQGKAVLDLTIKQSPTLDAWTKRADFNRKHIQQGLGLSPWPQKTPLNAIVRDKRTYDGYSVENVAFEPIPGFWTTATLYRPTTSSGPAPIVLSTHGHGTGMLRASETMQHRGGTLARMGAVVLSVDMFGYGDNLSQFSNANSNAVHRTLTAAPIQIWQLIRAIDFLSTLDGVDPKRIAVTGESGGGTQAFVLTALEPRIAVSIPVVMVSSYMFGGCPCESGRPIHRSNEHFITNAEIAALAAPRPMLVVSDGADWTQNVPEIEFPFLKKIYALNGVESLVENVHLKDERHDYGPSKRQAMYRFLAKQFKLNLAAAEDASGKMDESKITLEDEKLLHVWNEQHAVPTNALRTVEDVQRSLDALEK
jgi:dienelactone hydrolase